MKKHRYVQIIALLIFFAGCADESSTIVQQVNPDDMYHYSSIESFQTLSSKNDQYIIYFNTGDTIPLHITLNNDYVETRSQTINLTAKRTIYFMIRNPEEHSQDNSYRMSQNSSIYISFDAIQWVPVHDFNQLKQLTGIQSDNVSFGFRVTDSEGVTSQLVIDSF